MTETDRDDRDRREQRELAARGFLHPARSLYNLRAIFSALGLRESRSLLDLAAEVADPDLALNGLERLLARLEDPAAIGLLAREATLRRALLLAGGSEHLVETIGPFLAELDDAAFTDIGPTDPGEFDGDDERELLLWHRRETTRICLADLEGKIDTEGIAEALSRLADASARAALRLVGGETMPLAIIALGKWGGRELNYSSDIDFFFLRADDSDGAACSRVARRFLKVLAGRGDHLYRTDLRLRPGGPSAALVPSLAQARDELRSRGGVWERLIHIRIHAAAGDLALADRFLAELETFVYETPFHLEEIHRVKGYKDLLERTIDQQALGRQELKVGWGGIRDVEYIVQFLQLLHGAIYDSVRGGNVFHAIRGLARVGALTTTERAYLLEGYRFLRRVEHHLMLRHRRQTFLLPEAADARRALARNMGFEHWDAFRVEFDRRRDSIREIFDRLFGLVFPSNAEQTLREVNLILAFRPEREEIERVFEPLHLRDPHKAYSLLRRLAYPRRRSLQAPRARHFLAHLFPQLLARLRASPDPDQAVLMFANCVETLGAPATFYQLLAERPETCALFVDLFGQSRFLSDLLLDHPGILDEIIDRLRTGEKIEEENLTLALAESLASSDRESHARVLHEFRAIHLLEIGVLDLSGRVPLMGVLWRLSALARAILRAVDAQVLKETEERLGPLVPEPGGTPPRHAIIALGRLGGDEMGYASDIDLVLIHDGTGTSADGLGPAEFYTQHLQRLISTLTNPGSGGPLYSLDLRLRPYGRGGTLVHSFQNFRDYVTSDSSGVWEHQALVRSSPAAGDLELGDAIMAFVQAHLGRGLAPETILEEMKAMHARRKAEDPRPRQGFHLKTGPGGILDIEFLVQSAILLEHQAHPEIWEANTHTALRLLERHGIFTSAETASLTTAYTFLRLVENRLSMLHRASVRVVATDDSSLRDLAIRIGYEPRPEIPAEKVMLDEITYHTRKVREIFERHTRR